MSGTDVLLAPEIEMCKIGEMIAALILVFSIGALLHFAVAQWKAIWITVAEQPLTSCLQSATGISADSIGPDDFERLSKLAHSLKETAGPRETSWMMEVRVYYRIVRMFSFVCGTMIPSCSIWAKKELVACSRYAAAVLDQRLNADLAYASVANQ